MKDFLKKNPVGPVLLLMLVCLAPLMAMRDFSPANELRYLSIADEAISNGNFFAFTNQMEPYADKPPLYFWLIMLCRILFGKHSMFVLSLFSFIPAAVITVVMDRWTMKGESPLTRAAAAMMLCTTGMFLGMSVFLRMDMLMCMFILLALYAFSRGKRWQFAIYTFLALFTKGPVGLLVPPLSVIVILLTSGRGRELGYWFGWRFWSVLAACCALWFGCAYIEGGADYLDNLLFHQTMGRAVNAFHHKAPVWQYCILIWGVLAPWCLLTVPSAIVSYVRNDGRDETERMLAWTVITTFLMLSAFSSKLAIYLAPIFPFIVYLAVLLMRRAGYLTWMKCALAVPSVLWVLLGAALVAAVPLWDRMPVPAEFSFARSPLLIIAGVLMLAGGAVAVCRFMKDWRIPVLVLGASLLLSVFTLSWKMPQINPYVGYASLCEDIKSLAVPGENVYMLRVTRPASMDVYLGFDVTEIDSEMLLQIGALPEQCMVVLDGSKKDAYKFEPMLASSGRTLQRSGNFEIWYFPAGESNKE